MLDSHINPNQPQPIKIFGTYPQKQPGLFMQRIPVFAGDISIDKLAAVAAIVKEHTPTTPLHFTTRQNIELHNVPETDLLVVHNKIKELGFATFGAGGDSLRNITMCPCCKYDSNAYDTTELALKVKEALNNSGLLTSMPRKFKLAFSGCKLSQSKPYLAEFGIMALTSQTVKVVGAGSLGAAPMPGVVLYEQLPAGEVPALALAGLRLFVDHADRENRRKARMRHIRQRMGDAEFIKLLNEYFDQAKKDIGTINIQMPKGKPDFVKRVVIQSIAGDVPAEDILLLCYALQNTDARLVINLNQGIEIYSKTPIRIPAELNKYTDLPIITACPGNTTCPNGIIDAPALAADLSQKLKGNKKFADKTIAISGCPNNCMHSCVSNIGLTGRVQNIDGQKTEAVQILTGGENASTPTLSVKREVVTTSDLYLWLLDNDI